jgi:subtilisin family serine protease
MTPLRRGLLALVPAALAAGLLASPAAGSDAASYIVVLRDDVPRASAVADEHRRAHGARVAHTYESALKGYAAELTGTALAEVRRDRRVAYVERDGLATASATQTDEPWGLDRIDQRALPLSSTYTYGNTGAGVRAYVIDTGIRTTHADFGGRAVHGYDAIDKDAVAQDCNGHGTHVAGTVGGTRWGVAKGVTLVGVRVLECAGSGSWSGVIAGIDWVTANHVKPAVANMSLGGGAISSVDDAVRRMIAAGVSTAVAAGNDGRDACRYSPARVTEAMTIGATDQADKRASFSNLGSCVDWFAPGVGITSAWYRSDTETNTISGTSMASPHTAGVAALLLERDPGASPAAVDSALRAKTSKGVVTSSRTANNHLLFTDY